MMLRISTRERYQWCKIQNEASVLELWGVLRAISKKIRSAVPQGLKPTYFGRGRGTAGSRTLPKTFIRSLLRGELNGQRSSVPSAEIHHQQFRLGHLFDCIAKAFAAEAGIFDSAVGHVIDAEGRNVSSDHASDFELFIGLE